MKLSSCCQKIKPTTRNFPKCEKNSTCWWHTLKRGYAREGTFYHEISLRVDANIGNVTVFFRCCFCFLMHNLKKKRREPSFHFFLGFLHSALCPVEVFLRKKKFLPFAGLRISCDRFSLSLSLARFQFVHLFTCPYVVEVFFFEAVLSTCLLSFNHFEKGLRSRCYTRCSSLIRLRSRLFWEVECVHVYVWLGFLLNRYKLSDNM